MAHSASAGHISYNSYLLLMAIMLATGNCRIISVFNLYVFLYIQFIILVFVNRILVSKVREFKSVRFITES